VTGIATFILLADIGNRRLWTLLTLRAGHVVVDAEDALIAVFP
jgi:hypothetical protein